MSINAYKKTIRESESPRQIERRIFSRIIGGLERDARRFDRSETRSDRLSILSDGLRQTLTDNQAFWTALKFDLATPGNNLPAALRAQLLSISLWVDRQTAVVLGGGTGVMALLDVNRNIAAGLSGQAPGPRG
ncbi:flagellar biosynthesis regulator FlaF [Profundibacterium mesophilum]|uniref:FlaF protein n=1 Tax=Profundibacterium mesophilum KAUST100406-0324 TaxID=1037889 RepID=A0A921TCA0_9RHOB|nr:flagellar biosynthesis regulator FlaF [Profundibacterium mesophilum]KAF0674637.1 putative FlaF protein [Profundibacterium mesophilum KAUST100406-0324]